jgi:hypothetical protein
MRKRELLVERSQRHLIEAHFPRIAATLRSRLPGVKLGHVLEEIVAALLKFTEEEESDRGITIIELDEESITVGRGRRYASKGRPPRTAKGALITTLTAIYENATGRRIGRNVPTPSTKAMQEAARAGRRFTRDEKPHPFLAACMKAASTSYARRITRGVLQKRPTKSTD